MDSYIREYEIWLVARNQRLTDTKVRDTSKSDAIEKAKELLAHYQEKGYKYPTSDKANADYVDYFLVPNWGTRGE